MTTSHVISVESKLQRYSSKKRNARLHLAAHTIHNFPAIWRSDHNANALLALHLKVRNELGLVASPECCFPWKWGGNCKKGSNPLEVANIHFRTLKRMLCMKSNMSANIKRLRQKPLNKGNECLETYEEIGDLHSWRSKRISSVNWRRCTFIIS